MSNTSSHRDENVELSQPQNKNNIVLFWLIAICIGIIFMILIGGFTRLTNSGLSITEWKPVSGIFLPSDHEQWNIEFDKYQQSPEYKHINSYISLDEFKNIYLIEFIHRLAGRVIGLLFLIPLLIFLSIGYIKRNEILTYIVALFILCFQGFLGWYMVKSGLMKMPHISHFRLAAHLFIAILLYIILFWKLLQNTTISRYFQFDSSEAKCNHLLLWAKLSITLLLVQIILGALVSGLDAGLIYNQFPLMGDSFVPSEIANSSISLSSFSDPVFVQFIHRISAYTLFIIISIFSYKIIAAHNKKLSRLIYCLLSTLIIQVLTGIFTLIYNVPISFALIHQINAVLLLSFLLTTLFIIRNSNAQSHNQ